MAGDSTVRGIVVDGFQDVVISNGYLGQSQTLGGIGIDLEGMSGDSVVGCFVGTNAAGTAASGNYEGIAGLATIGGLTAADRNVISGNVIGVSSQLIEGNDIGTDLTGRKAVGNGTGILVLDYAGASSQGPTIGGTAPNAGNIISGNRKAGVVTEVGDVLIEGNAIGVAADGSPLGNGGAGVVTNGAATIGGTVAGAGNTIADNGGDGVNIVAGLSFSDGMGMTADVAVRGNSIHDNAGVGVDYEGYGVIPNFPFPPAGDYPFVQDYPDLTSAAVSAGMATVSGTIDGTFGSLYAIDIYANDMPDAPGTAQGRDFLGSTTGITDSAGHLSFKAVVPDAAGLGNFTATAVSPTGSTSEFSPVSGSARPRRPRTSRWSPRPRRRRSPAASRRRSS